jgi:hypothetical protein
MNVPWNSGLAAKWLVNSSSRGVSDRTRGDCTAPCDLRLGFGAQPVGAETRGTGPGTRSQRMKVSPLGTTAG